MRLTAVLSRDLFERDYDTEFDSPRDARLCREALILQLLEHGYEVRLTEPTWTAWNPR